MVDVYNIALDKTISVSRIIGKIKGLKEGPTIVFFGGIHGNESSGVFALKKILDSINPKQVKGTIYGISGNLKALSLNKRYISEDLNRLWLLNNIESIKQKEPLSPEEEELLSLLTILNKIIEANTGPFYFIDLHTTSSKTLPFITINDALINRKFSQSFPVPIVLGIEEYLNGPLLSYINELGYVSLGFESGQHDEECAIHNSIAFIYLTLVLTKALNEESIKGFPVYYNQLKSQAKNKRDVFEVIYRHKIAAADSFKMHNGFKSFQAINKGTKLAVSNNVNVNSEHSGLIFMPLYQTQGEEGFFIIRPIKPFFLKLSAFLRGIKIDGLLVCLPGISWFQKEKGVLKLNLKVAKFFAKSFFHLLGYRSKQSTETYLKLNNRERVARTRMYKNEIWYKN